MSLFEGHAEGVEKRKQQVYDELIRVMREVGSIICKRLEGSPTPFLVRRHPFQSPGGIVESKYSSARHEIVTAS